MKLFEEYNELKESDTRWWEEIGNQILRGKGGGPFAVPDTYQNLPTVSIRTYKDNRDWENRDWEDLEFSITFKNNIEAQNFINDFNSKKIKTVVKGTNLVLSNGSSIKIDYMQDPLAL